MISDFFKSFKLRSYSLYIMFGVATVLLFLKGMSSFITSSEFWSIFLSQHLLPFQDVWPSVFMKPIFHSVLALIHLLEFSDTNHIYFAKLLFTLNGIAQFFLVYFLLNQLFKKSSFLNLLLTAFLFLSPLILTHFDRIRSDQLALTVMLFYLYFIYSRPSVQFRYHFAFLMIFPLIGFKHIYFSILVLFFIPLKSTFDYFKTLSFFNRFIIILLFANALVWGIFLGIPSLSYFLAILRSDLNFRGPLVWLKTEWFFIYLSLIPFFIAPFRKYLKNKGLSILWKIQCVSLLIIVIHPQKFPFFIASFLPLIYLNGLFFIHYLKDTQLIPRRIFITTVVGMSFYNLYLAQKHYRILTTNQQQFETISALSKIITENNLTYLDGMGVLPTGKNVGCFVSPEDDLSNQACLQFIKAGTADAIIVTNRLMTLGFDFSTLGKYQYHAAGPNLFIHERIKKDLAIENTNWAPPILIFSSEQLN